LSVGYNGGSVAQARLVNGQWTMDVTGDAQCADGSRVNDAFADHYTDANMQLTRRPDDV
jgi:hypothetical protein